MSYAIVPSFTPAPSVTAATHFWCLQHSTIAPSDAYNAHTHAEHDGSPPCVMHLVAGTRQVPVGTPDIYCSTHDIFDCPFAH